MANRSAQSSTKPTMHSTEATPLSMSNKGIHSSPPSVGEGEPGMSEHRQPRHCTMDVREHRQAERNQRVLQPCPRPSSADHPLHAQVPPGHQANPPGMASRRFRVVRPQDRGPARHRVLGRLSHLQRGVHRAIRAGDARALLGRGQEPVHALLRRGAPAARRAHPGRRGAPGSTR